MCKYNLQILILILHLNLHSNISIIENDVIIFYRLNIIFSIKILYYWNLFFFKFKEDKNIWMIMYGNKTDKENHSIPLKDIKVYHFFLLVFILSSISAWDVVFLSCAVELTFMLNNNIRQKSLCKIPGCNFCVITALLD